MHTIHTLSLKDCLALGAPLKSADVFCGAQHVIAQDNVLFESQHIYLRDSEHIRENRNMEDLKRYFESMTV